MSSKRDLTFRQLVDLSFGFFGVQIAYALQSANISRIFATLGADPHQLSFFWILPPLMGMIVQPLIGKYSDRTWCRMGRRKPYLIVGALIAVLVMIFLPNAGSLHFSTRLFLGLNMAMWFGLFSLIFLDTSINIAMQPFKMMVGDMVNEKQKTTAYSIQSFLCNAGSLVGYLFPIFFTWIGIANTAPEGVIPDSVKWSFYIGAAILILCVLYTFLRVKEMDPKELAERIREDLRVDAMMEEKKRPIPYRSRHRAEYLESLLYLCPKCRTFDSLYSGGSRIRCECGYSMEYSEYGYLTDESGRKCSIASLAAGQKRELTRILRAGKKGSDMALFLNKLTEHIVDPEGKIVGRGEVVLSASADGLTAGDRTYRC